MWLSRPHRQDRRSLGDVLLQWLGCMTSAAQKAGSHGGQQGPPAESLQIAHALYSTHETDKQPCYSPDCTSTLPECTDWLLQARIAGLEMKEC